MGRIQRLDPGVAERIAAGEVVERPASVVKELLENALDAGARRIELELEGGGLDSITVTDDGCGMEPEDARLALERFATSKIRAVEDLESLVTLGFRGEALPSIAAVSRLELLTRTPAAELGYRVVVEGGRVLEAAPAGAPLGTRVKVTNLFFNTPARRKFLRSSRAEGGQCTELVGQLALSCPEVYVVLRSGGKDVLDLPPHLGMEGRLERVLGWDAVAGLIHFTAGYPGLELKGYLSHPSLTRPNRKGQVFFLNGRLVRDGLISSALGEGYAPLLDPGRFPLAVLGLELPGGEVDVNVHPTKQEVRFSRPRELFARVRESVHAALQKEGLWDELMAGAALGREAQTGWGGPGRGSQSLEVSPGRQAQALEIFGLLAQAAAAGEAGLPETGDPALDLQTGEGPATWKDGTFVPLAQLARTYIVGICGDDLWVLDQHTAHERVNYHRLKHQDRPRQVQTLLIPLVLDLSLAESPAFCEAVPFLEEVGFQVEPFGEGTWLVRGVPAGMSALEDKVHLQSLVEDLCQGVAGVDPQAWRQQVLHSVACRGSVMAGDALAPEEMSSLVRRLAQVGEDAAYCPHGRPVMVRITPAVLTRLFKRA